VLIERGKPFFGAPDAPDDLYRISYSSIASERIPEGIARIARTIEGCGARADSGPMPLIQLALITPRLLVFCRSNPGARPARETSVEQGDRPCA
jgi:hypothetical protein